MRVQKCYHLAGHMLCAQQTCPNQTGSFYRSQYKRFHRQRFHIILQFSTQIFAFAGIVDENDFLEQWSRWSIYYTPNCSQQCRPCLVMEYYHNCCGRQFTGMMFQFAVWISYIGQRSIQRYHITGHQIELILLEFFFHKCLLFFWYYDRFACELRSEKKRQNIANWWLVWNAVCIWTSLPISPGRPYTFCMTGADRHFFNSVLRYVRGIVIAQSLSILLLVSISLLSTMGSSSSSTSFDARGFDICKNGKMK